MAKKAPVKKVAVKKTVKKVSAPVEQQPMKKAEQPVQEVTPAAEPAVAVQEQTVQTESTVQTKEEPKMEEEKGVGKEYNPADFSQPAVEAGSGGSSKIFLYVGISIAVLALIVGGLFLSGILKTQSSSEELTGASVVTAYCTDSDGGYNRFTKGVAEGTYYLDYKTGTFMDQCAETEENKLTEYYCKNDLVVYTTEPCPEGMTCADGICQ